MAREGYLVNAGKDTIHDPEAEKRAEQEKKTPQGKWDNFWYYHKIHVIIGVIAALIVGYIIWTSVKTVQPDYTIGMLTQQQYPDAVADAIKETVEKYGEDLNHDGKVTVQINQYPITSASGQSSGAASGSAAMDPQMVMAYRTKFATDVQAGTSMIFITDDTSLRGQETSGNHMFAYTDGRTPKDNATDYDNMRISFSKCPKLANIKVSYQTESGSVSISLKDIYKDASISLRVYTGSAIEGKQEDYYKASKALFDKLTA